MNGCEQELPVVESLPRPRPRRKVLMWVAGTLWLPTLLPLVLGMLRDSSHAVHYYLISLPLIPGVLLGALLQLKDGMFFVVAVVPTVLAFAGLYAAGRRLAQGWWHLVQGIVIVLVAFESIGYAQALRA